MVESEDQYEPLIEETLCFRALRGDRVVMLAQTQDEGWGLRLGKQRTDARYEHKHRPLFSNDGAARDFAETCRHRAPILPQTTHAEAIGDKSPHTHRPVSALKCAASGKCLGR